VDLYCEFVDTGTSYNNKIIYSCKYCNIKLTLDNPETDRILCFGKRKQLYNTIQPELDIGLDGLTPANFKDRALDYISEKFKSKTDFMKDVVEPMKEKLSQKQTSEVSHQPCSEEQIDARLAICNTCEFYKDNSCLHCGCVIVRESNYMNKLAHKEQSCPINKWGPITD